MATKYTKVKPGNTYWTITDMINTKKEASDSAITLGGIIAMLIIVGIDYFIHLILRNI
jgi:hypothetical protein